ncbi:Dicer-like protein 2 [Stygiomarasmius scandens]|uniref:Dicer-like protein 2 n=1 Tax=Marasmiellus scandens TaxID=2682957 RepID=A0ABR1JGM3_9AGAR
MICPTKALAYQHVASHAYLALYENRLLSDRLLPITDHEMKEADEEIEKRVGLANVSGQIDPWAPLESSQDKDWFYGELAIGDFPGLHISARTQLGLWTEADGPMLYRPTGEKVQVTLRPLGSIDQVAESSYIY